GNCSLRHTKKRGYLGRGRRCVRCCFGMADAHVSMQNLSKQNRLDSWFVCATFLEKSRAKSKSKKQRSWGALVREAAPFSRAAVAFDGQLFTAVS
ncbi:MAG: hypothetical protein WAV38_30765, partial [Xanthobacteraceae bacterium]